MASMSTLKAVVCNGRLTLDEPTELAEGTVIELVEADPYAYLDETDELDDEERARLNKALDRGWAQAQAGLGTPAEEVLQKLRER